MQRINQAQPFLDTPERDTLVLNYTMACPLKCDFCCYGCHPKRKEKMEFEKAKELISEAATIKSISCVGFTGGEVFLHQEELVELSHHLKAVCLPFTVATAAHWGEDAKKANILAELLVNNGLRRANISFDRSHAEFVNKTCVVNAASAFAKLRIPVYIVGTFESTNESLEQMLPELLDCSNIKFVNKRISKVGKATKFDIDYSDILQEERVDTCYRRIYHDLVVFWDGNAYPCCSTFNRATPGIQIGNVYDSSLTEIWNRLDGSLLFLHLKRDGFKKIYQIAERYDPGILAVMPKISDYPGACSLCSSIFKNKSLADRIKSAFAEYEIDVIARMHGLAACNTEELKAARLFDDLIAAPH